MTSTIVSTSNDQPKVGVGVIVKKDGKILLGKRINAHGHETWNFPGGHLEMGETPEECAQREVIEEAGISIKNLHRGPWTNDFFQDTPNKHYVTLYIVADYQGGQTRVMEPDKCNAWEWFSWDELPKPLFLPIKNLLATNFNPFK